MEGVVRVLLVKGTTFPWTLLAVRLCCTHIIAGIAGVAGWLVTCVENNESLGVHVTRGRRVIFQELIRNALPSMLGWTQTQG
jgi:hypothetical protein